MSEQRSTRPTIQFAGPKADTLFHVPLRTAESFARWNEEVPALFERASRAGDDRSLVLFSALLVEAQLDELLGIWIPRYSKLANRMDLTFSLKLDLLDAMRLIPRLVVRSADCVRDVRNKFAHRLACDHLDQLEAIAPDVCARVKACYVEEHANSVPFPGPPATSLREQFDAVAFTAICGLRCYQTNLHALRKAIDDPEFIEHLVAPIEDAWQRDAQLRTLRNMLPAGGEHDPASMSQPNDPNDPNDGPGA